MVWGVAPGEIAIVPNPAADAGQNQDDSRCQGSPCPFRAVDFRLLCRAGAWAFRPFGLGNVAGTDTAVIVFSCDTAIESNTRCRARSRAAPGVGVWKEEVNRAIGSTIERSALSAPNCQH